MRYFIVISMLLLFLLGCTPSISVDQYNSLQSELKSTKEQLAAAKSELQNLKNQPVTIKDPLEMPRQTWSSFTPYLDYALLVMENNVTWQLKSAGKLTQMEANNQTMEQSSRLTDILKKIDNKEFVSKANFSWYEAFGTKDKYESWAYVYDFLIKKCRDVNDKLTSQLKP